MKKCAHSSKSKDSCIGLFIGAGDLPKVIINHLVKVHKKFVVIALKGNAELRTFKDTAHTCVSVGEIGKALDFLKANKVVDIAFVGKVQRPPLLSIRFDRQGLMLMTKLGFKLLKGGDDKIISVVVKLFSNEGYRVVAPESLLPQLTTPSGVLGKIKPSTQDHEDVSLGRQVLSALGNLDVGQAVVVENSNVLGIEGAEGTDKLISRCGELKKEKQGGVLVKMKKTNQERKVDLPAVGVQTVMNVHKARLKGIAVEAGASLIIDLDKTIEKANKLEVFVVGV